MHKIFLGKKLVAVHVRRFKTGAVPVTSVSDALQMLTIKRKKGEVVLPHVHLPKRRVTKSLQECLIVIQGKIRYTLFGKRGKRVKAVLVKKGEALLNLGVPHAVRFLEDSLVYELKNGPFINDKQFL